MTLVDPFPRNAQHRVIPAYFLSISPNDVFVKAQTTHLFTYFPGASTVAGVR